MKKFLLKNKKEILELLDHSRYSCDEKNPNYNGTKHYENGASRCKKCALMLIDEFNIDEVEINLDLTILWK